MDTLLDYATPLLITSLAFSAILLCLPTRYQPAEAAAGASGNAREKRVVVLVLGDIGRSPRMQYHALSIARNGGKVDLVGYNDSKPRPELLASPNITVHSLPSPPPFLTTSNKALFPVFAPLKILFQLYVLLNVLLYTVPRTTSYILLQNPPSMPTFVVALVVGKLRGMRIVVDWHNFAWTILEQKLGSRAPIIHLARLYEHIFGKIVGEINFTVTDAMKDVLRQEYGITTPIHTLYDRPPSHFHPISSSERHAFLSQFPETADLAESLACGTTKLLVSSTSWTPDEDFQLLLDALVSYDRSCGVASFLSLSSTAVPEIKDNPQLPDLLLVITGKGPLKEFYLEKASSMDLQHVRIRTAWLEAKDYPTLLACADLGVCLHTSSSGVDLPMKVVDMFGVGVPVAAVGFRALGELVRDGENGVVFKDAEELGNVLERVFDPEKAEELKRLKAGAEKETERRWDQTWDEVAAPVFGL